MQTQLYLVNSAIPASNIDNWNQLSISLQKIYRRESHSKKNQFQMLGGISVDHRIEQALMLNRKSEDRITKGRFNRVLAHLFFHAHYVQKLWTASRNYPAFLCSPHRNKTRKWKFKHDKRQKQRESNPQPLSLLLNTQPFNQTWQKIELCCEYLSARRIWLDAIIMSRTRFRVNLHSMVAWMWRKSLLETGAISED